MASEILKWLQSEYAERLASAVESMTGESARAACGGGLDDPALSEALVFRQPAGLAEEADLWFAVPEQAWRPIGRKVLEGAGIEDVADDEARGTFLEVLQQSVAPLAQVLGGRLGCEVTFPAAELDAAPPPGLGWVALHIELGGAQLEPVALAVGPGFEEIVSRQLQETSAKPVETVVQNQSPVAVRASKTMDLLMEVELPVGVSFGRVQMKLRDAVKLTTGSIVELNRRVIEPVEVIVNNCVIARGEVVVVEGNYGVRIQEIVSREERLRTLF